jgi:hypothetical protein
MSLRQSLLAVAAVIALAFGLATALRGRADWSPPKGPAEPGRLAP